MRIHVSDELKTRLASAAANGSVVAGDILAEIRRRVDASEIIRGTASHFSTKRKKQSTDQSYSKVKIVFTACTKDVTHPAFPDRSNPRAPWFPENRTDIEPSTFVGYFKNLPEYDDRAMSYFANAICVGSKVQVKLCERMQDFIGAYNEENYAGIAQMGESSLHGSCMRYEITARNAADFYCNFAGAKIIVARDAEGNIMGRAVLWPQAVCKQGDNEITLSVLDRVYFTYDFVICLITGYAKNIGVHLRKHRNDNNSPCGLVALNTVEPLGLEAGSRPDSLHLYIPAIHSLWHKKGAPYLDTFYYVIIDKDKRILLSNKNMDGCVAKCRSTGGLANKDNCICPSCGEVHCNDHELCGDCYGRIYKQTVFGMVMTCKTVEYKGNRYPSVLFSHGRPGASLRLYFQVEKLYG